MEALWHAIIRKNYGCTHFIVGPNHASLGPKADGKPFYEKYAARNPVTSYSGELGIEIVPFEEMAYVVDEDVYLPVSEVPKGIQSRFYEQ